MDELVKYTRDKMLKAVTILTHSESGQHAFLADPPSYKASSQVSKEVTALSGTEKVNEVAGLEDTGSDLRKRHIKETESPEATSTQNGLAGKA